MKAVVLEDVCNLEDLKVSNIPIPKIKDGWVLVKVLGFGINRSELILCESEARENYINLPVVPGIECYGKVVDESNSRFQVDDYVVGLMGGMGRSFDGSYEEYVLIPEKNLFKIPKNLVEKLSAEEIAAIPETFFTAYGSLFDCLNIKEDDSLLIRGATSTVGIAAIQLANKLGVTVIATTRTSKRIESLKEFGADYVFIDDNDLSKNILSQFPEGVDKILELVGPLTMKDSFKVLKNQGILCVTGILGGLEYIGQFDPIKDIPNNKYLCSFFSNYPSQEIITDIYDFILENNIRPVISDVFSLDEINKALVISKKNNKLGKIVIKV